MISAIPKKQLTAHMRVENPWWNRMPPQIDEVYQRMRTRAYFERLASLVEEVNVRRAVVLMGPRRVGKTVLLQHIIQKLLDTGIPARSVAYLSLDQPLYSNLSIEELYAQIRVAGGLKNTESTFLFLDEIQYLRDWERHLKVFVDAHPRIKCVVSGSAAAALRLKSTESGAGRFTDFFLPSLTFYEYLTLQDPDAPIVSAANEGHWDRVDVEDLNERFTDYINFGGYPEVIFSDTVRRDMNRYVRNDIIDKVLLRDLPSLYGIQDIQELNALFITLAWNTAQEVSLDKLSHNSGVTKPTLKRYLEYLEAAFLIKTVHRIDHNAKRFKRVNFFKVYLTNPSMHYALFGTPEEKKVQGALVETAVFAQWFSANNALYYARWQGGEVDIVSLDQRQRPKWCVEVKWSDRNIAQQAKRGPLKAFLKRHPQMERCIFTTRTKYGELPMDDQTMQYLPVSVYCHIIGNVTSPGFHNEFIR